MAINATKIIAKAKLLIEREGRAISLLKPSVTNSDATKVWRGSVADATPAETRNVKGVFTNFEKSEIDGKNILFSDYKIIIPSTDLLDAAITESDMDGYTKISDGSNQYQIVHYKVIKPGNVIYIYQIQARI